MPRGCDRGEYEVKKKVVSRRPACACIRCACECVWVCVSVHSGVKFYWVEIRNICKLRNNLMARLIGFLACTQRRNEKNENISKKSPARRNERERQPWEKGRPEKDCMARWGRVRGTGLGQGLIGKVLSAFGKRINWNWAPPMALIRIWCAVNGGTKGSQTSKRGRERVHC